MSDVAPGTPAAFQDALLDEHPHGLPPSALPDVMAQVHVWVREVRAFKAEQKEQPGLYDKGYLDALDHVGMVLETVEHLVEEGRDRGGEDE